MGFLKIEIFLLVDVWWGLLPDRRNLADRRHSERTSGNAYVDACPPLISVAMTKANYTTAAWEARLKNKQV